MKLTYLFTIVCLMACSGGKKSYPVTIANCDSVRLADSIRFTSNQPATVTLRDSIVIDFNKEIYMKTIDSLKTALFLAKYKIEKVRFYVNIVNRNPSQIKYLKGWCIRAIE